MKNLKTYCFLILVTLLTLFAFKLNLAPLSYLHSWNQISTLTTTNEILKDPSLWYQSKQLLYRLDLIDLPLEARFIRYQEFPLYHLVSALIFKFLNNLEAASRIISIVFWLLAAYLVFKIGKSITQEISTEKSCGYLSLIFYLCSFPFIYYGQAIMSDMAMTSMSIACLFFILKFNQSESKKYLYFAAISLSFAALFKSYAIVFCPLFLFIAWKKTKLKNIQSIVSPMCCCLIACLPVALWHLYCFSQAGQQEVASHSIAKIFESLLSFNFYKVFFNYFIRYLGHLGLISILYFLFSSKLRFSQNKSTNLELIFGYLGLAFIYVILTADKIIDHDYYCLIFFIAFFWIGEIAAIENLKRIPIKFHHLFIILLILPNFAFSLHKFKKATRNNNDVIECSKIMRDKSAPEEMVAYLSSASRQNALAYYSDRRGIKAEFTRYPISAYREQGAKYLLLDLSDSELNQIQNYIKSPNLELIFQTDKLVDSKKQRMHCRIYKITNL